MCEISFSVQRAGEKNQHFLNSAFHRYLDTGVRALGTGALTHTSTHTLTQTHTHTHTHAEGTLGRGCKKYLQERSTSGSHLGWASVWRLPQQIPKQATTTGAQHNFRRRHPASIFLDSSSSSTSSSDSPRFRPCEWVCAAPPNPAVSAAAFCM